ncbi:MAG: heavy-metal-associated domain-containing protein [Deltaproteobacteria bacterium]|nr:heavy-metal-associated domain-containing protein [Deltaproteobacteria bacterium]
MLKSGKLGILSVTLASACCGIPLLLIALGLGGLGFGVVVGKYHWYFTAGGIAVLLIAWGYFLREKRRACAAGSCIQGEKRTKAVLITATLVVLAFSGLNVYSTLVDKGITTASLSTSSATTSVILPIEGMTCVTCEKTVQGALKELPGIVNAKASAKTQNVLVEYQPGQVTFEQMVSAIKKTGYKATLP